MTMFGAFNISSSGLDVYRTWMDAVSDNMANMNTVRRSSESAFQSRSVIAAPVEENGAGVGARVAGVEFGNAEGRLVHEPNHPLADEQGMVRYPDIDLSEQMTGLMMAQRGYQANLAVVQRAKDAYQAALTIGRG